ncbi:eCIS core domain-containing protein [Flindersiella endophytica]
MSKISAAQQAEARRKPAGVAATEPQRRRKRGVPPMPAEILNQAGRPLDAGLRREMEARLGSTCSAIPGTPAFDFSRVRIHADRDADALTSLLGADAVAVGTEIFFAAGQFRPETDLGRSLLAHELLHTVQVPNAPGPLRLGREPGAVSLPQDFVERQAEQAVRGESGVVEQIGARPSWLRFATLTADQRRVEQLDPATVVDRVAAGVLRNLRGDPSDASGRVRLQLVRLAPELKESVLDKLSIRLPTAEYVRVVELVDKVDTPAGPAPATVDVPAPLDPIGGPEVEQAEQQDHAEAEQSDRRQADRETEDVPDEEQQSTEDTDIDQERNDQSEQSEEDENERAEAKQDDDKSRDDTEKQKQKDSTEEDEQKEEDERARQEDEAKAKEDQGKKKDQDRDEDQQAEQQQGAAAGAAESAAVLGGVQAAPAGLAPMVGAQATPAARDSTGGQESVREDRADQVAEDPQGPLVSHGLDERRGRADEETAEQEEPVETEPSADAEVAEPEPELESPEAASERAEEESGEDKPPPDPIPKNDLDVSQVPTADEELRLPVSGEPPAPKPAPSFPAPPPVEAEPAEQEDAEREERAEEDRSSGQDDLGDDRRLETEAEETAQAPDRARQDPPEEMETDSAVGVREPRAEPGEQAEPAGPTEEAPALAGGASPGPEPEPPGPMGTQALAGPGAGPGAGPEAGFEAGPGERLPGGPGLEQQPAGPGVEQGPAMPGALPADASLETGGGGCAGAAPPTTEAGEQGGEVAPGGAGGGGEAAAEEPEAQAEPPDVSAQEPKAALAVVGKLPAAHMPMALGGVDQSVGRTAGEEHQELAASPPSVQRPSGAPQTLDHPPKSAPPAAQSLRQLVRVTPEALAEQRRAHPPPTPAGPNPASGVQAPNIAGNGQGQISQAEVTNLQAAVDGVPTTDARLHQTVGPAPKVKLEGETDPALGDEQNRQLREQTGELQSIGREDSALPLGEDQIYPNVPGETLRASVPGHQATRRGRSAPAGGGAAAGPEATDAKSLSLVAEQEKGQELRAGFGQGDQQMGTAGDEKSAKSTEERQTNQEEIDRAIAANGDQQALERTRAKEQATGQRAAWRAEQDKVVGEQQAKADTEHTTKRQGIYDKKSETDASIETKKNDENARIERERKAAEEKARKERQEKKEESSSWFDRAVGWVKDRFDDLVNAIKGVFDAAVKLINDIKDAFKDFVNDLIDKVAGAIIGLINLLADALILISGVLLAAFPGIRDKFRTFIENTRDAAVQKVQEAADSLKKAVNALIDKMANALIGILRLYEKALLAAVNFVRSAVMGALEFVRNAIKLLGEFAALVKDIAPDPIGWLKKLGVAARDGIRNHLWNAVKTGVRQWFNEKVESVVGIGKLLWNVLVKGCMSVAQIGQMAWQAIIKALPMMIITLVIEKLVSLIIPAAGAILTIIQGLVAAWGTVSRIIAAFSKFFTFLKSVKGGGPAAAGNFAAAVAAGVVALLEFIANFLLARLGSALKGVGGRLKALAQKIMKGLGRGAKSVRRAAGRAVNAARSGMRRGAAAVRSGVRRGASAVRRGAASAGRAVRSGARRAGSLARTGLRRAGTAVRSAGAAVRRVVGPAVRAVGRTLKRVGRRIARSRVGRALARSARRLGNALKRQRDRFRNWRQRTKDRRRQRREDRKKKPQETKEQRLARIVARIKPRLARMLDRGVGRLVFGGVLTGMRLFYRLSALVASSAHRFNVEARLNPVSAVIDGIEFEPKDLVTYMHRLAEAIIAAGQRTASPNVERAKFNSRNKRRLTPAEESSLPAKKQRELIEVRPGARGQDVHAAITRDPQTNPGTASIIRYLDQGKGYSKDVGRKQGGRWITDKSGKRVLLGNKPENQLVLMEDPKTGRRRALTYPELTAKLAGNDAAGQRRIAIGALARLQGRTPVGAEAGVADELSTWIVQTEARRNPAAFVTSALALDTVARAGDDKGAPQLSQLVKDLPMGPAGAQQNARDLDRILRAPNRTLDSAPKGARELAQAEINALKIWVETLHILTDDDKSAEDVQTRLKIRIRDRMFVIYALTPAERTFVIGKVGPR